MATKFPEYIESSTPLAKEAIFTTGTQVASTRDSYIVVSIHADQAGTLHIEQGPDGTHWNVDSSFKLILGEEAGNELDNGGGGLREPIVAPFWRVRHVNGAEAQGTFSVSVGTKAL